MPKFHIATVKTTECTYTVEADTPGQAILLFNEHGDYEAEFGDSDEIFVSVEEAN